MKRRDRYGNLCPHGLLALLLVAEINALHAIEEDRNDQSAPYCERGERTL